MIQSLKNWLRGRLRARGIHVFGPGSLPRNVDLGVDLSRFRPLDQFKTAIDVGANEGQTARLFLDLFPAAKITSFEPVPSTYAKLAHAFPNHPRVTCENLAVGNINGIVQMLVGGELDSFCARVVDDSVKEDAVWKRQPVKAVRLEEYLAEKKIETIDLLKTDTEGRDLDVLKGCSKLLRDGKVPFILCEVGFSAANSLNSNLSTITEFLNEQGFFFFGIYDPRDWTPTLELVWADALFVHRKFLQTRT